jgi:hypothetical protein
LIGKTSTSRKLKGNSGTLTTCCEEEGKAEEANVTVPGFRAIWEIKARMLGIQPTMGMRGTSKGNGPGAVSTGG